MTTPMFDVDQTVKDLESGIAFLKVNSWGQGSDYDRGTGAFCAHGAIRASIGALTIDESGRPTANDFAPMFAMESDQKAAKVLRDRVSNVARAFKRVIGDDAVNYNDAEGRTKAEIIVALETVLAVLREDPERAMGKEPVRG